MTTQLARTFVSLLKNCTTHRDLQKGLQLHAQIAHTGLICENLFIASSLVHMYVQCGSFAKALQVFHQNLNDNTVLWNPLITGLVKQHKFEEAIHCLDQMQLRCIMPDEISFICILKACGAIASKTKGLISHTIIQSEELIWMDLALCNALVVMYGKCGLLTLASKVFDWIPIRDIISWSALISGYADNGYGEEAINYFEQIGFDGLSPDSVTFLCALKACGNMQAIEMGHKLHSDILKCGMLEARSDVGNSLVDMYAKCGSLLAAKNVFDRLSVKSFASWNALIAGHVENEEGEQALKCFEKMQLAKVLPTHVTFICSLKACAVVGAIAKGEDIHNEILKDKLLEQNPVIGNALVDMYAKCGSLNKARKVFDKLPARDVVSWTALMTGYAQTENSRNAFSLFSQMLESGVNPSPVTFMVLLNVCSRNCLLDMSMTYFETMSKDYGITPMIEHHSCIVDLLSRSGHLYTALQMVKMSFGSDLLMWHTVLSACKSWGNVEVAKLAFNQAISLDEKDSVAYVLMSHALPCVSFVS